MIREGMIDFAENVCAVLCSTGDYLDGACAPRIFRQDGESDESLRRRWFQTFDVSTTDVLVENYHLYRQVKELQEALTDKEMVVRELRRALERNGRY